MRVKCESCRHPLLLKSCKSNELPKFIDDIPHVGEQSSNKIESDLPDNEKNVNGILSTASVKGLTYFFALSLLNNDYSLYFKY